MKTFKTIQLITVIIGMISGISMADNANANSSDSFAGLIMVLVSSVLALTITIAHKQEEKNEWKQ